MKRVLATQRLQASSTSELAGRVDRFYAIGMKSYGQFCPIAKASEILAERWTPLVVRELICGSHRFNDIHRGVPLMSRAVLAQRLRRLVDEGIVEHRPATSGSSGSYHLTQAGSELEPIIMQLGEWGARWARSRLEQQDLDATLLVWDMRRNIRPDRFPKARTVVAVEFLDTARSRRFWWLVSDGNTVDLCAVDPGFDVDLRLRTSLQSLTAVWTGDRRFSEEIRTGRLVLSGPDRLCREFPNWLGLSPFATVTDARDR